MHTIKKLSEQHYSDLMLIEAEAYPGMKIVSAEDRIAAVERLKKSLEDKRRTWYGAFRESKLVGAMETFDFIMNVRGTKVAAGGVGGVAVDLMHKKEHVARDMMAFYLDHYYKKGAPMAVLWPFHAEFYRKMGFGLGARMYQYRVKTSSFPQGESKKHVRYLAQDDIPEINDCYNRFVEQRTGMIEETEAGWRHLLTNYKNIRLAGYDDNGVIRGYLVYRFQPNNPRKFLDDELSVIQMVYETPDVLSELLTFLRSQLDQVKQVIFHTPEDEFYYLLSDPYNDSGNLISPTYQESHTAGVGIMYRVLNSRKLFELLGDHSFGGVTIRLKLTVRDSFFPENDGSLVLHVADGRVSITDGGEFDVEISLDIAEFSSMFMGAVGFRSLITYQLAEISDQSYVDTVHRMFATAEKPLCTTSF